MNSIYEMCRCILIRTCLLIPLSFATGSVLAQGASDCPKPTGLHVSDVSENTAVLNWEGAGAEQNFEIEIRSKGRTPKLKRITRSTSSSVMIEALMPGSDYKFRVRSQCSPVASSGSTKWFSFQTAGMSPEESCPKASDLIVANATLTTATLLWSGTDYVTHYEVEVRSKGNTPAYFFEKSVSDTSVTIFGLSPTGKYQFRVRTTCENTAVSGSTSWKMFVPGENTGPDTCDFVSDLIVDSISTHAALISWSSTDGNAVFALHVSDSMGFDTTFLPATNPTLLEGLMADAKYFVSLQANCATGIPKMLMATFSTPTGMEDTCMVPGGLIAQSIDSLGFELSWDQNGASSYQLQIDDFDTISGPLVDTIVTETLFQFSKIDSIEGYSFRVRAMCSATSISEYSDRIPFPSVSDSALFFVCDTPANLLIDSALGNNAFLSWSGPADALFQIQVKTADTLWSFVLDAKDTSATLILSDLDPFTDYEVRVRSLCSDRDRSEYTEWIAFTTREEVALCLAPSNLVAARLDDSTAELTWIAVDSATSYIVQVQVIDTGATTLQLGSENITVEVSGLLQGIDYQFRVQSICSFGDTTDFSDWVEFNLDDTLPEPCEPASDLMIDTITSNSAIISWTGPESSSSFQLFIKELDTIAPAIEYFTEDHFIYFDSLMPATEYEVYIQTICGEESSGFSETISFETLAEEEVDTIACEAPDNFRLDSVDATNAWVSWDGADSLLYLVRVVSLDSSVGFGYLETVGETFIHLEDLLSSQSYSILVKALCSEGDTSMNSEIFIFQTLDAPNEPSDSCRVPIAEISQIDEETATVHWTTSSENAFYLLEVENLGLTPHFSQIATSRDTNFRIEGLVPGGIYQWKVAGFCDGGTYSDCSPWMIFETPGGIENSCPSPTGLQALITGEGSALLSWDDSPEGLDYEVEVESLDTTPFYSQNSIVLEAQLGVDGLAPSGLYQFKVNVQCSDGTISEDSDWIEFRNENPTDTSMVASSLMNKEQMAFPNPARTVMMVKVPEILNDGEAIVELSDMMGRTVMSEKNPRVAKADLMQFNVGNLREGIYKLSVRSSQGQFHELVFVRK